MITFDDNAVYYNGMLQYTVEDFFKLVKDSDNCDLWESHSVVNIPISRNKHLHLRKRCKSLLDSKYDAIVPKGFKYYALLNRYTSGGRIHVDDIINIADYASHSIGFELLYNKVCSLLSRSSLVLHESSTVISDNCLNISNITSSIRSNQYQTRAMNVDVSNIRLGDSKVVTVFLRNNEILSWHICDKLSSLYPDKVFLPIVMIARFKKRLVSRV